VEIQPFLDPGNFVLRGKVSIEFECCRHVLSSDNVTVHARNLTVAQGSVSVAEVGSSGRRQLSIVNQSYDEGSEFYTVQLGPSSYLRAGNNYTLYMEYSGFLGDNLVGFYRSSYKVNNETK
jgi:hypothetical protein